MKLFRDLLALASKAEPGVVNTVKLWDDVFIKRDVMQAISDLEAIKDLYPALAPLVANVVADLRG